MENRPRQFGKAFEQFVWFRKLVTAGKRPFIVGPDYVVMSKEHYDELNAKANPMKIYFDEARQLSQGEGK